MTDYILVIVLGGLTSIGGIQIERMPGPQCLGVMKALEPLENYVGAACISPEGVVSSTGEK